MKSKGKNKTLIEKAKKKKEKKSSSEKLIEEKKTEIQEMTEQEQELENLTTKFCVHNSCALLLSCTQLYFLKRESLKTKKKKMNYNESDLEIEEQRNVFLKDQQIYQLQPKQLLLCENTSSIIPFYNKKNQDS